MEQAIQIRALTPRWMFLIWLTGATLVAVVATLATAAPLATYSLSLAVFGVPHVLAELRYVDLRFHGRIARPQLSWILGILFVLAIARAAVYAQHSWHTYEALVELLILALLALLHNLTPIGFLAERLQGRARFHALFACALAFLFVPTYIVLMPSSHGSFGDVLPRLDVAEWTGPLANHLAIFVPRNMIDLKWAPRLFSAAAYLQVLHYIVVLAVLPRLVRDPPSLVDDAGAVCRSNLAVTPHPPSLTIVSWPSTQVFRRYLIGAGTLSALIFAISFHDARLLYAIPASVHAFVEFPILLLAIGLGARSRAISAA